MADPLVVRPQPLLGHRQHPALQDLRLGEAAHTFQQVGQLLGERLDVHVCGARQLLLQADGHKVGGVGGLDAIELVVDLREGRMDRQHQVVGEAAALRDGKGPPQVGVRSGVAADQLLAGPHVQQNPACLRARRPVAALHLRQQAFTELRSLAMPPRAEQQEVALGAQLNLVLLRLRGGGQGEQQPHQEPCQRVDELKVAPEVHGL